MVPTYIDEYDIDYPGINTSEKAETLLLLGLMVLAEEPARQQAYSGDDVAFDPFPKGFHANLRDDFRETQRKIRNSLRHAKPGSVQLLDNGTVEWLSPQGKSNSLSLDELREVYRRVILASSIVVPGSTKVEGRESYLHPSSKHFRCPSKAAG